MPDVTQANLDRAEAAREELWTLHRAYDDDPTDERWRAVKDRARELRADPATAPGVDRYDEDCQEAADHRGYW